LREWSEPLRPQQRIGEVEQQAYRDETGERIIEDHGGAPSELSGKTVRIAIKTAQIASTCPRPKTASRKSEPFAGVGVTDRGHEEAEAEGQHENIQHGMLLCGVIHGAKETPLHWA
jgi:hypothetical protein